MKIELMPFQELEVGVSNTKGQMRMFKIKAPLNGFIRILIDYDADGEPINVRALMPEEVLP